MEMPTINAQESAVKRGFVVEKTIENGEDVDEDEMPENTK